MALLATWASISRAQQPEYRTTADIYSTNDFGGVGLLNMRTARFAPDGSFEVGVSLVNPYRRYHFTWQIFPWLEATFRYTDITNIIFDQGRIVDQSQGKFFGDFFKFKQGNTILDRGADLKLKLWEEGPYKPALAVGLQDDLGTGLFSGEYLVASKRYFDLDITLGIGWGYFASKGAFKNPLRAISSRFKSRGASSGRGGTALLGNFFAGEQVGLFGGIEYFTPVTGLSIKAEFNSADPAREPSGNSFSEALPIGIGINYRPQSWVDLSLGLERGNSLMLRLAIRHNFNEPGLPKFDPPPPPLVPRERRDRRARNGLRDEMDHSADAGDRLRARITARLSGFGLEPRSFDQDGEKISLIAGVTRSGTAGATRSGRAVPGDQELARALFAELPEKIDQISLTIENRATARRVVLQRSVVRSWARADVAANAFARSALRFAALTTIEGRAVVDLRSESGSTDPAPLAPGIIASKLLGLLPGGAQTIEVAINGRSLGRLERGEVVDALFVTRVTADIEAQGFPVRATRVTARSAVVEVKAPYWAGTDDYREVAAIALRASSDLVDELTIVGNRLGLERGRVTVRGTAAPVHDPEARVPSAGTTAGTGDGSENAQASRDILDGLSRVGIYASAIHISEFNATIYGAGALFRQYARNLGWITRVAAGHLPPSVEEITVVSMIGGIPVSKVSIMRRDFERAVANRGSPEEILAHAKIEAPDPRLKLPEGTIKGRSPFPSFLWSLRPDLVQHLGDPSTGLYLADVDLLLSARLDLAPGLSIRAAYRQFLFGNLDKIKRDSDSVLPRVRSNVRQYLQQGHSSLQRLQLDYLFSPRKDIYARVSAGIFEWMFGGVGGEVLYRPYGANWAIGANINWVAQRDFNQGFGFRSKVFKSGDRFDSYQVVTGHVTVNYEIPASHVLTTIDVGRYLAKDWGATFTVSREFKSGVRIGAWATKTNVSAADFGEGSFDKGFFIVIPLDMFMLHSNRNHGVFSFRPLSRDGGQKLLIGPSLYDVSREGNTQNILKNWDQILE